MTYSEWKRAYDSANKWMRKAADLAEAYLLTDKEVAKIRNYMRRAIAQAEKAYFYASKEPNFIYTTILGVRNDGSVIVGTQYYDTFEHAAERIEDRIAESRRG